MDKILSLYKELLNKYGDPEELWPDWCSKKKNLRTRELIALGAILTQRTSWRNANLALKNLINTNLYELEKIAELSNLRQITDLIRPAGFYTTKPKRLQSFSKFVVNEYGGIKKMLQDSKNVLREKLLKVYGIGPETADTLLLYALDKPSFVVDEYAKRFLEKYSVDINSKNYDSLKKIFENLLPEDTVLFQNYHVLMIVDQKGKRWSKMEKLSF